MTTTSAWRRSVRVAIPLGLAGAVVGLAAAPALAAASLTVRVGGSSVDGSTLRQNATLQVTGSDTATDRTGLSRSRTLSLSVNRPDAGNYPLAPDKKVASDADGTISGSLDTSCPPWNSGGCTEAVNGDYIFTFSDGSTTRTSRVTLQVPPATPSGFAASTDQTVVTFTWQANSEPDLVGYDIVEGDSNDVTPGGIDPSACDSGGCSISIDFGSSARGTSATFHLFALRHTAPGSSSTVASGPSAPATANFPAPTPSNSPSDSPSSGTGGHGGKTGSGGGGSTGSGGGTGTGNTGSTGTGGTNTGTSSGPASHPVSGRHPAADLQASLPTVSAGNAPDLPSVVTEVKPLPQGTYKPTLAYPDQVQRDAVRKPVTAGAPAAVVHGLVRVLDTVALWRTVAGAAVVLLLVAHLHAWLRRVEIE